MRGEPLSDFEDIVFIFFEMFVAVTTAEQFAIADVVAQSMLNTNC